MSIVGRSLLALASQGNTMAKVDSIVLRSMTALQGEDSFASLDHQFADGNKAKLRKSMNQPHSITIPYLQGVTTCNPLSKSSPSKFSIDSHCRFGCSRSSSNMLKSSPISKRYELETSAGFSSLAG
ncbi:hypothetical protein Scep_010827 [Stephania cephalantha]|uniref:Uncharacterized protein n=1 Tax=Stephania cephalantha TaxID=152367 RepID=A0AAP0PHM2_9MAGN